jgi:hypothetical protein
VKKEKYSGNKAEFENSTDESDDDSDPGLTEPKHSPMRRKEKFRTKDFKAEKKHKDRRQNLRSSKYDFEY